LLYVGGLRRAEVAALEVDVYNAAEGSVRVLGKGNKERMVRLNDAARAALDSWLAVRGDAHGPLICPVRKGGKLEVRHMTGTAILQITARRALAAGVAAFSPHDLRRSHATHALDATGDLSAVAAQLGHASVATTRRYDRRGERAQLRAVRGLSFPFRPPK
jgi:site-specific recombinase XerC